MRKEEGLTPAEAELEAALAGLQPAGTSIDRDQLMYRTGYAAGNRRSRVWQGTTMLLAVGLAASLVVQGFTRHGGPDVQIATGPAHVQPLPTLAELSLTDREPASPKPSYLLLRNEVQERGMAALPCGNSAAPLTFRQDVTMRDLLDGSTAPMPPVRRLAITDYILLGGRS
jgi:hypothetical protein